MSEPSETSRNPYAAALRGVHDRAFDREGIPMVLALESLAGPVPAPTQPAVLADGARIAATVAAARAELFPTRRDADLGCLISTIQAATTVAFDPEGQP